MEAVGRLAGGLAHNFNSLLTAISGYCELALVKIEPGSDARKDVEEIRRATARAIGVTRGLLTFSRREEGRPELLDVGVVALDMEALLGQLIGADIEMETAMEPGLAPVRADRSQIEQVIVNLVVNARDAMPQGGRLVLEVRNLLLDVPLRRGSSAVAPGRYVSLCVSDTGVGMDERTLARVFEPFLTTKGELGTGLGLATVFAVVQAAGGQIVVESRLGAGTSFTVFLPVADE
jgi:two-component system cell cycle sensor histidine kinase/response regulator CckA